MKLIHVVGARPNFIKLWPVYEAAKKKNLEQTVIHTGQHYDYKMSKAFFDELGLPEPDTTFDIPKGLHHGRQTAEMLARIEGALFKHDPKKEIVIVYGDVNSTLAGAIAAVKLGFCVAHVEAGIRSWDWHMPEEINRMIVDEISTYRLCPSEVAMDNLQWHGYFVGDVTYDAFLLAEAKSKKVKKQFINALGNNHLEVDGGYIFVTIHRENNSEGDRLSRITTALEILNFNEDKVIWPVHPRIQRVLGVKGGGNCYTNFQTTDPISYFEALYLIKHAKCIVTDSGGIQKEAFWSGVPCVVVRDSTEWPELIDSGWNVLVEPKGILEAVEEKTVGQDIPNPYGDGKAAEKIIEILLDGENN